MPLWGMFLSDPSGLCASGGDVFWKKKRLWTVERGKMPFSEFLLAPMSRAGLTVPDAP